LLVIINGEERNIEDGLKVSDLVPLLELKAERLAIEVNRKIIRRAAWQLTPLAESDKIEIVQFVGGGSLA
jgi:thiamine biosynthesis protein ThiS